jgi:hypothetical protein
MLVTAMYQVVVDTNVLVAALLSSRGASHRLLRLVGDHRWRINLSVPLVFEYEQTLKWVCTGRDLSGSDIDSVVHGDVRIVAPSPGLGAYPTAYAVGYYLSPSGLGNHMSSWRARASGSGSSLRV